MSDVTKLRIGDRVNHKRYGEGTVTDMLPIRGDIVVTVVFDSGRTKKLCASVTELEELPHEAENENE